MASQPAQSPVASSSTLWAQGIFSRRCRPPSLAYPRRAQPPRNGSFPPNLSQEGSQRKMHRRRMTQERYVIPYTHPPSAARQAFSQTSLRRTQRVVASRIGTLFTVLFCLHINLIIGFHHSAAQRAFRERKQSQLAELQARVQSYEQGEIERNVALQQIAKRLKEENEQLKTENASLKEEITRLKDRVASASASTSSLSTHDKSDRGKAQKRWREDSACSNAQNDTSIVLEPAFRKRFRPGTESPRQSATPIPQYGHANAYAPSSPSIASSPDSNDVSRSPFSPLSFAPLPSAPEPSQASTSYSMSAMFSGPSGDALKSFDALGGSPPFDTFDCGLCTENTPCVCRELAMQSAGSLTGISASLTGFPGDYLVGQDRTAALKVEDTETRVAGSIPNVIDIPPASDTCNSSGKLSPPETGDPYATKVRPDALSDSHTDSSNPYQIRLPSPEPAPSTPAATSSRSVPLRLKHRRRSASGKVWQVNPVRPTCSGDPSNCPACKDDDFGKAFCRALGDSASTVAPACASCPNPEACGKAPRTAISGSSSGIMSSSIAGPKIIELPSSAPEQGPSSPHRPSGIIPSVPNTAASTPSVSSSDGKVSASSETIPANEAWARLKSHPNIAFADLRYLLASILRINDRFLTVLCAFQYARRCCGSKNKVFRSRRGDPSRPRIHHSRARCGA